MYMTWAYYISNIIISPISQIYNSRYLTTILDTSWNISTFWVFGCRGPLMCS